MEELSIVKQSINLLLWLEMHTKLNINLTLNGKEDFMEIKVYASEKTIIDFKVEALSKKTEERINIELKLIVVQLIELKNDKHFQE
jgi:hypothetical protein